MRTRTAYLDAELRTRLDLLATCPSLFQQRIKGHDVRLHVVVGEYFAERVYSTAVDYRYLGQGDSNDYAACLVPYDVESRCFEYCHRHGLLFAGFDFKVSDEDGRWYVLEANPMPGYEPYDRRSGGRISRGLARILALRIEPFVSASRRTTKGPLPGLA